MRFVTSADALQASGEPSLALIDLDAQADVMQLIGAFKPAVRGPVVAFGPHLDTDKRKAARSAGADRVLAKSRFVAVLPSLMHDRRDPGEAGDVSAE